MEATDAAELAEALAEDADLTAEALATLAAEVAETEATEARLETLFGSVTPAANTLAWEAAEEADLDTVEAAGVTWDE